MRLKSKEFLGIVVVLALLVSLLAGALPVMADDEPAPSPYAVEVVDYSGSFGNSPYDDPNAVLGKPTVIYQDPWTSPPTELVKLVEPAWNVGLDDEPLITTINAGEYITVKFDHHVENDPNNPYGIDFIVFGNALFVGAGGTVSDESDMDTYMLDDPAGCLAEPINVAVSQDGTTWYEFNSGPYADSLFPTHAYEWDSVNHQWTDNEMDFTKPVDPSLTLSDFDGLSAAQAIALYDGSGGGTGYDLDDVGGGLDWIQYVRVTGSDPAGEIDAFADVAPVASTSPWDVNGDGEINVSDLILVGKKFGQSGSPGWIPEDVNSDGHINVSDFIIIGQHFGG